MSERPAFHEDLELTRQARAGDASVRERLAVRLRCVPAFVGARNANLGYHLGRDDLDDLVQDVVMAVWKKISQYRGEAPLEGWVYQFCVLEMKNFMRRKINRESRSERLDEKIPVKATAEDSTEDLYEDIYAGLGKISPDCA